MMRIACWFAACLHILIWPTAAVSDVKMPWPVVHDSDARAKLTTGAINPEPSPRATAISQIVAAKPMGPTDEDIADDDAIKSFYSARQDGWLWVTDAGLNPAAEAVIAELQNAKAWGLDPTAFSVPIARTDDAIISTDTQAQMELQLTRAVLLYARHARGGRIMAPSEMLNSHLNRTPQLLNPTDVLNGIAAADVPANYVFGLHPQHEQFQRLRQAYLRATTKRGHRLRLKADETLNRGMRDQRVKLLRSRLGVRAPVDPENIDLFDDNVEDAVRAFQRHAGILPADGSIDYDTARALNTSSKVNAAKLQANMEMWRWMWDDLGELHVMANVPEFMLSLKKNGETLYRERVVVGQRSKQTSIFTRTLKHIVLRPMWRVPESIKVRELWPSLRRGGGLMREHRLLMETKDGEPVNWRSLNWYKEDIRNYEVVQRPGRHSAMGKVKFSFPSQHTIFIHDTPDKYMFRSKRRTFSHGCLRLRNPVQLAELILQEDRGWDRDHVNDLIAKGPNRNALKIETRIPMHLVYFTAWVTDDGKLKSYSDIYGHEKRVRQALKGQWNKIAKGRNHLAPPQPISAKSGAGSRAAHARKRNRRPSDYINRAISGGFF